MIFDSLRALLDYYLKVGETRMGGLQIAHKLPKSVPNNVEQSDSR